MADRGWGVAVRFVAGSNHELRVVCCDSRIISTALRLRSIYIMKSDRESSQDSSENIKDASLVIGITHFQEIAKRKEDESDDEVGDP